MTPCPVENFQRLRARVLPKLMQSPPALSLWGASYRWTLAYVPNRLHLPYVLNRRRLLGVGYEIGVHKGEYSAWLLSHWKGKRLVSVDSWSVELEEAPERPRVTQLEHDEYFDLTRERLAPYGARSQIWREESTQAAEGVPIASADFVYIDGRHDYESISADIQAWLPRVRPGGLLAGHDYYDGDRHGQLYGVKRAVEELCGDRDLKVMLTRRDYPEQSWLVFLPDR